jgi:hypothetical protein
VKIWLTERVAHTCVESVNGLHDQICARIAARATRFVVDAAQLRIDNSMGLGARRYLRRLARQRKGDERIASGVRNQVGQRCLFKIVVFGKERAWRLSQVAACDSDSSSPW